MYTDEEGVDHFNIVDQTAQNFATAHRMSFIQSNPQIFAAPQTIDGEFSIFGAYDIIDETIVKTFKKAWKMLIRKKHSIIKSLL